MASYGHSCTMSLSPNTVQKVLKNYLADDAKVPIKTTYNGKTINALNEFMKDRNFLNEGDALRFIVNAVLKKEGYMK
jgi:hypothetical protein